MKPENSRQKMTNAHLSVNDIESGDFLEVVNASINYTTTIYPRTTRTLCKNHNLSTTLTKSSVFSTNSGTTPPKTTSTEEIVTVSQIHDSSDSISSDSSNTFSSSQVTTTPSTTKQPKGPLIILPKCDLPLRAFACSKDSNGS